MKRCLSVRLFLFAVIFTLSLWSPLSALAQGEVSAAVRATAVGDAVAVKGNLEQPSAAPEMIAGDLQKIVVLCAAGQYSPQLDQSWRAYVESHYQAGMDLDGLLSDIFRRANAYRRAMYQEPPTRGSRQSGTQQGMMKSLHDAAKSVIQNMR